MIDVSAMLTCRSLSIEGPAMNHVNFWKPWSTTPAQVSRKLLLAYEFQVSRKLLLAYEFQVSRKLVLAYEFHFLI